MFTKSHKRIFYLAYEDNSNCELQWMVIHTVTQRVFKKLLDWWYQSYIFFKVEKNLLKKITNDWWLAVVFLGFWVSCWAEGWLLTKFKIIQINYRSTHLIEHLIMPNFVSFTRLISIWMMMKVIIMRKVLKCRVPYLNSTTGSVVRSATMKRFTFF